MSETITWVPREDGACDVELPSGCWRVRLEICSDPGCDATDGTLVAEGPGGVLEVDINLVDGSTDAEGEAAALARSMPEHLRWAAAVRQREERQLQRVTLPRARVTSGTHVLYGSLASADRSVFEGGRGVVDVFELDGERWLLDESFCPNPSCRCEEVKLAFVVANKGNTGFDADVELGRRPVVRAVYDGVDEARAERVLAHYVENRPRLQARLRQHYDDVKAIGTRSLAGPARRAPKKRPSRNGPCPCGSGRRYKACCGRT